MRKLLLAGAVLAAPLLAWPAAHAAPATPMIAADHAAVSPSVQKVFWVYVGPRRVWRPYRYYAWHPYWRPAWRFSYWHRWVPGHWAWGHWVPGHYA